MPKILIKNGKVWDGERFYFADILTENEKIAKIVDKIYETADFEYDASGKIVSAGLVDAHDAKEVVMCKYYKSIEIDENDTLWSIAKEYAPDSDIENYIAEVEEMNGIDGNQIHTGDYIIVPYYSSDVK